MQHTRSFRPLIRLWPLQVEQANFWRTALAGLPEELNLPADRPRPAVASYRGDTVPIHLHPRLHGQLLKLAQANGASLFMVLQAGLATLLSKLGEGGCLASCSGAVSQREVFQEWTNRPPVGRDVMQNQQQHV